MSAPRQRADRLLVDRGLFESRAKAQAAIEAGLVFADDQPVRKASEELATDSVIRASAAYPYVSRGGIKLAAALEHFGFDPKGRVCLDVGASPGGCARGHVGPKNHGRPGGCPVRPHVDGAARGPVHADDRPSPFGGGA